MFHSKYLPVNLFRENASVHSFKTIYPADLLTLAHEALENDSSADGKVTITSGKVSFLEHPEIVWTVPEIYLAWEAYQTGIENKFSYYVVNSPAGTPALYVSREFKKSRIIVCPYNYRSLILTKPQQLKKVSVMIDKTYPIYYCTDMFNVFANLESHTNDYLDAIIVDRDNSDESLVVSPITALYTEHFTIYSKALLDDYRKIIADHSVITELAAYKNGMLVRQNLKGDYAISEDYAKVLLETYEKAYAKKSNYVEIMDGNFNTIYYVSTNWKYLVDASTFEVVVINGENTRNLVKSCVKEKTVSRDLLYTVWNFAKLL